MDTEQQQKHHEEEEEEEEEEVVEDEETSSDDEEEEMSSEQDEETSSDDEDDGVIIASVYPNKVAFRIRRRGFAVHGGTSMLITNRLGVWSVARRRYVRKTRYGVFNDLNAELPKVRSTTAPPLRQLLGEVARCCVLEINMEYD
uniref:Uncharacterized protein n=1 Tax=Oryza brachyantha TaxID=4533 RepID=J3NEX4_ORYBR